MNDLGKQPPPIGAAEDGQTSPAPDMQFEEFEPASPQDTSDAAPTGAAVCAACQQPITDAYYEAGGQVFCPQCRENYQAQQTGGSRTGRMLRAVAFGTLAGIGGTIIWFGVRKLTGYEVGLIAVVVGFMVGGAVRAGSRGRGGAFYQVMAVFITYCSIVASYVPDVFQMMFDDYKNQSAAVTAAEPATQPLTQLEASVTTAPTAPATATTPGANAPSASSEEQESGGAARAIVALVLISLIAFAIAFTAPVLMGFSNIIGLLIIGFALWEAWKLNKRTVVDFTGPYELTGGAAPPAIPGAAAG